ncbi:TolB family protein [Candidatus Solirubrobacter pratensis]|uniref:TolB family protein n=1 Tax=Candidatus Solirubrobacter pratensis TaxID=1298857 RepID=UPI00041F653F|nr:LpqB family beta-propeller domain-containing protein [Candidatus Solirubrobacter pratensis]
MPRVIGALCCALALLCAPADAATDGQLIAIVRTPSGDRLVTFNSDGGGVRTILSGQRLSSPGWSPDGNLIAVVDGQRVLVLELATGAARTVLDEPGAAGPTWAPDGARLALLRGSQAVTMRLDGTAAEPLPIPFSGQLSWLSWSPDGERLAYGTSGMLRTIGLDGAGDRAFATGPDLGEPAWSPDSARIAYRDGARLRIAPAGGDGDPFDLTRTGGDQPDWAPDGRELVYAFAGGVRVSAVDGGATRAVLLPADGQTVLAEPDWQPCVAGVTTSCRSGGAPPPADPASAPPGAVNRLPVPVVAPPPPRAPYLSALSTPRLDGKGRGWLLVRCDADCTVSLRLVVKLHGGRTIDGRPLSRRLRARAVMRLRMRAPERRRLVRAWVRGTVKGEDGRKRSVRIPVTIA